MKEIPVLPLSRAVLFPHGQLPIPIKENRSGFMIRDVLTIEKEIGVLYSKDPCISNLHKSALQKSLIGCVGIVEMFERLPLGRMNILLRGGSRFRVERLIQARPYYRAEIAYLDDNDFFLTEAEKKRLAGYLFQNIKTYLKTILKCETINLHWKFDQLNLERLINQAAMYLDMNLQEKQRILEFSSLETRYQFVSNFIEEGLAVARFSENRMCILENPILN
ncbi:MAG: LON peptidase substrate-binding domain-containing protein [bacterium]